METEREFEIITEHKVINYPNGDSWTVKYKCDTCLESNYPMVTWPTDDDWFIYAVVCNGCIDKMAKMLTKSPDSMKGDIEPHLNKCWCQSYYQRIGKHVEDCPLAETELIKIVAEEEKQNVQTEVIELITEAETSPEAKKKWYNKWNWISEFGHTGNKGF
jgi:hypothetical protein